MPLATAAELAGTVIVWEFENDQAGLYSPYSDKVSNYVEDQYEKDKNGVASLGKTDPLLKQYEVDFASMSQLNNQSNSQGKKQVQICIIYSIEHIHIYLQKIWGSWHNYTSHYCDVEQVSLLNMYIYIILYLTKLKFLGLLNV